MYIPLSSSFHNQFRLSSYTLSRSTVYLSYVVLRHQVPPPIADYSFRDHQWANRSLNLTFSHFNGATNCHYHFLFALNRTVSCCSLLPLLFSLSLLLLFIPLAHLAFSPHSLFSIKTSVPLFLHLYFICYLAFSPCTPLSFKYPENQTDRSDPFLPSSLLHQHRLSYPHPN